VTLTVLLGVHVTVLIVTRCRQRPVKIRQTMKIQLNVLPLLREISMFARKIVTGIPHVYTDVAKSSMMTSTTVHVA